MSAMLKQLARIAIFFRKLWKKQLARQLIIGGATFTLIVLVLVSNFLVAKVDLKVGQVAPREIVAPRTIVDRPQTELLEQEAAKRAVREAQEHEENYVISQTLALQADLQLEEFFNKLEEQLENDARPEQVRSSLGKEYQFSSAAFNVLLHVSRSKRNQLKRTAKSTLAELLQKERISEKNLPEYQKQADRLIDKAQLAENEAMALKEVVSGFLQPNLILDPQQVEKARQAAIRSVEPVMVLKDQVIIRRGDKATPEHIQLLRDLGMQRRQMNYLAILGVLILTSALMLFLGGYLYQFRRDILREEKLLSLFALIVCVMVTLIKLVSISGTGAYLIPTAFATMLIAILLDLRLAIVAGVMFALTAGIVADNNIRVLVVNLVGGIAGAFCVSKISQRSDITRAGFLVGIANFFAILGMGMLAGDVATLKLSWLGFLNGIISAILTIGTLPYLETLFHLTSAIKLLELSNPNHPLLRRLLVEAAGTYHHSLLVGNLAEAASEEVGGDSVLVRVGAYYHDIGKIKRPYFFTENQFGMENPHDKIAPGLSTLIITSHVKDGVELAREHKLPESIIDLIRQHHGTDLVKYFYSKAQENDREKVFEKDFRYPGPRPQTKEAAVLMLADSVEAAVRSLREPSPGRIEGLVRKIIKERLAGGQLDESDLTFRDLDKIANSFVRTLCGIYHKRIEYPQLKTSARA